MALFILESGSDENGQPRTRLKRLTCEPWDWDYRRPQPLPEPTQDAPQEIPAFLRRSNAPAG